MGDYYQSGGGASGGGSPPGQSLGGGPTGPTSPEEIRRRRLATLERIGATNTSVAPPTTPRSVPLENIYNDSAGSHPSTPPSASARGQVTQAAAAPPQRVQIKSPPQTPRGLTYVDDGIDDDDNAELQAALALSLNEAIAASEASNNNNSADDVNNTTMDVSTTDNDETDRELQAALSLSLQQDDKDDDDKDDVQIVDAPGTNTTTSQSNITQNSNLMERANLSSTPARFIGNPGGSRSNVDTSNLSPEVAESYKTSGVCDVLEFHNVMWDSGITTDNDKLRWLSQGINFRDYDPEGKLRGIHGAQDSVMGEVIANHGPWGLTQAHGGPCGVLASVQAELLRLLLFGSRDPLDYPVTLNNRQARAKPDLTDELMLRSLAMSIALIVARATLTPPANDDEKGGVTSNSDMATDQTSDSSGVKIVLPIHPHDLAWEDFEPWYSAPSSSSGDEDDSKSKSARLRVFTIPASNMDDSSSPKRQKINGSQQPQNGSLDERIRRLAHSVSQFLLEAPAGFEAPLQAFRRPGGVVLLVMSLAFSRGPGLVQNEMDDPAAKLTSQFGHCGQELINLLLTGQAVSNVFDNTLRPSGEFVCRGVQARPVVGYLTQLEAMRYLEVGGYYKTPRFPIWVVGSTSHFTVMFGDATCLQESQSDVLLEKCRRAFKAIDGGEENGFIPTQALGGYLKSLDLDIADHGVQTLAATLEVHGAGIILWEDLWKHTSRLMTGASLESVLQLTDTQESKDDSLPPLLLTQFGDGDKKPDALETDEDMAKRWAAEMDSISMEGENATLSSSVATAVSTSILEPSGFASNPEAESSGVAAAAASMEVETPMTDEELARKLQEEWNAEYSATIGGSGNAGHSAPTSNNSITAVRGSPTPSNWSNLANDDMNIPSQVTADTSMNASGNMGGSSSSVTGNMTSTTTATTGTGNSNLSSVSSTTNTCSNPNEGGSSNIGSTTDGAVSSKFGTSKPMEHEKFGRTFQLYHYNGLRGGSFKPFRVTRLSPEEAVGASISLMGSHHSSAAHNGNGDLEDVVRTKWPSSMINWLGSPPPSID